MINMAYKKVILTQEQWKEKNGFGEDGLTWCIFGDDTYSIKDHLKELGCKFSPALKWHSPMPLDLPVGYGMFSIHFDEIMIWSSLDGMAYFTETAEDLIQRKFREAEGPSLSDYYGFIGERFRDKTVTVDSVRGFANKFGGWTNILTFSLGDNKLVWMTQTEQEVEKGDVLNLSGTIKQHQEYQGVKQTYLSRCILKKIGE